MSCKMQTEICTDHSTLGTFSMHQACTLHQPNNIDACHILIAIIPKASYWRICVHAVYPVFFIGVGKYRDAMGIYSWIVKFGPYQSNRGEQVSCGCPLAIHWRSSTKKWRVASKKGHRNSTTRDNQGIPWGLLQFRCWNVHFHSSHRFKKVRCISNGCQLWGSLFLRHFWGNVIRIGSDHIYLQILRHRIMILRAYFFRPMLFSNGAWVSCGEVFFKLPPEKSPQLSECFSQGTLPW